MRTSAQQEALHHRRPDLADMQLKTSPSQSVSTSMPLYCTHGFHQASDAASILTHINPKQCYLALWTVAIERHQSSAREPVSLSMALAGAGPMASTVFEPGATWVCPASAIRQNGRFACSAAQRERKGLSRPASMSNGARYDVWCHEHGLIFCLEALLGWHQVQMCEHSTGSDPFAVRLAVINMRIGGSIDERCL